MVKAVRNPTGGCLRKQVKKAQKASVAEDNETDEEELARRHQVRDGQWAKGERELVIRVFKEKAEAHKATANMATALAKLAAIMEQQLYGNLLKQAITPPVAIQVEGRVWMVARPAGIQPEVAPAD